MKTIFVSSTFKDMQYERDAIREITSPILNAEARKYGDEFDFCDLRWGINTCDLDSDESSKKVLDVCLDEIDRCKPPMVVLLGYRYGWIPEPRLIKNAADRKHLTIDDLERSVTALEIEYGALCDRKKFDNTLFYFREIEGSVPPDYLSEDRVHEEKITALKERIRKLTGGKIRFYTLKWNGSNFDGVEAFAKMLADDIMQMLLPEWKQNEKLSLFERERRTHLAVIHDKNVMFRARKDEADKFISNALSQPVTIIKGEVGSGKSTLFSHMATELEKTEWTVLPFISSLTSMSNDTLDIIRNTVYFLEDALKHEHFIEEKDPQTDLPKKHTIDEWREKLAEMCYVYTHSGKKLIIMLDAADQLSVTEERDKLYFIPTNTGEKIHFVMTCTTDFKTPVREYYTLRELNEKDKQDVVDGILLRNGREISKPVREKMLSLKSSDNPLYLSLLVQRMLMMNSEDFADIRSRGDGMEAIEQHQIDLIENNCPDDLDDMSAALLHEAGRRINEKLVEKAAQYLAISRSGLRKKDLSSLLGDQWTEIDFSHFVSYMSDCFIQREDGRYDFTHKSIRAGFLKRCEDKDSINLEILNYLKALEPDDTVRISEIIYHTIRVDDKQYFVNYIIEHESGGDASHINQAAIDTYTQCMNDNGQWICTVLSCFELFDLHNRPDCFTSFINFDLKEKIVGTQQELEILLIIQKSTISLAETLVEKNYYSFKDDLANCYECNVHTYIGLETKSNLESALKLCNKAIKLREEINNDNNTINNKRSLAFCYELTADIYRLLSKYYCGKIVLVDFFSKNSQNYFFHMKSLDFQKKAVNIFRKINEVEVTEIHMEDLAMSYSKEGLLYYELHCGYEKKQLIEEFVNYECYNNAVKLFEQSLYIRETYILKYDKLSYLLKLNESYKNLIMLKFVELNHKLEKLSECSVFQENVNDLVNELVDYSVKVNRITDRFAIDLTDVSTLIELKKTYEFSAKVYSFLGNYNLVKVNNKTVYYYDVFNDSTLYFERALELWMKVKNISKQVFELLYTKSARDSLYEVYSEIIKVYDCLRRDFIRKSDVNNKKELLSKVILWETGSINVLEERVDQFDSDIDKMSLIDRYDGLAKLFIELRNEKSVHKAMLLYNKAYQIAKKASVLNEDIWICIYSGFADVYDLIDARKSLEYKIICLNYYKNIMIEDKQNTLNIYNTAVSFDKVADSYKTINGRENINEAIINYSSSIELLESVIFGNKFSNDSLYMLILEYLLIEYKRIADTYLLLVNKQDKRKALEYYCKYISLYERFFDVLPNNRHHFHLNELCVIVDILLNWSKKNIYDIYKRKKAVKQSSLILKKINSLIIDKNSQVKILEMLQKIK